jgi:agmatine/peptidylarginine deiminase
MMASRLALALVLLLPAVASAQELADLSGTWSIPQSGSKHRPGSALFYEKEAAGQVHRYKLRLVLHTTAAGVTKAELKVAWDGTSLVVGSSHVTANGLVNVITGSGSSSSTASYARYTLQPSEEFDLESLVLSSGTVNGVALPRELRRTSGPDVRAPAEWEQAEEILWGYRDEFAVARIYAEAIKGTADEAVTHWLYVTSQAAKAELEYELAEAEAPMDRVRFSQKKFQTVWMRDFGPITLERADGKRVVGDMGYYGDRPKDDFVPAQYAKARKWELRDVEDLLLEGGNYMADGKGRVFTTSRALEVNPSAAHVEDKLRDLGAREVLFFERMPEPEGTGHIDMFAKLVDEDTVLVGKCTDHPKFAAVLDRNAERFRALGYEVIRLTMASGPKLMTYTNSLFVGKTVLVPVYAHETRDPAALKVYADLGWKPVGIDARTVIKANGAIHCISMQIPK